MLVQTYYVKDIKEYENENNKSVFDMFARPSVSDLVDLVILGNNKCSRENASDMLDTYLESHEESEAYDEIRSVLFGDSDSDNLDESDKMDVSMYKRLGDLFHYFCMNLMSQGLSYTEFWQMDTRDVYKIFEDINIKLEVELNKLLSMAHAQAAMTGSAVWGKLDKEPPKVDFSDEALHPEKIVYDEELGEIEVGVREAVNKQREMRANLNAITKEE